MPKRLSLLGFLLIALLAVPAAAAADPDAPRPAVVVPEPEAEEWPSEECGALDPWFEECEPVEDEGESELEECVVQDVSARVAAHGRNRLGTAIRYTALEPVRAYVVVKFSARGGLRSLGPAQRRLAGSGVLRLDDRLSAPRMEQARRARRFVVTVDVPGAPTHCRAALTRRLHHRGAGVWTEPGR